MAGREYLNRQAATLLKFAKTTTDPTVPAGLVEKAAISRSRPRSRELNAATRRPMLPAMASAGDGRRSEAVASARTAS